MKLKRELIFKFGKLRINSVLFYVLIHLFSLFFIFQCINLNLVGFYRTGFIFYWKGSFGDFQEWFPEYYRTAYILVNAIGISFIILICFILYKTIKKHTQFEITDVKIHFKRQGFVLIGALFFYLTLYFIVRNIFQKHDDLFTIQRMVTHGFLLQIFIQVLVNIYFYGKNLLAYFKEFLLAPSLPYNIAILRVFFFLYLIYIYIHFNFQFLPIIGVGEKVSLPYIGFIMNMIPVNKLLYISISIIGVISCLFITIGYRTKSFLILNAICCLYVVSIPNFYGKLWHFQILIWISWFFTFSKCYDVFSIDSYFSRKQVIKSSNYTFPIRFVWLQFGVIYFWAGFYKLWDAGFDWALNKTMINQVQLEWIQNYDKLPSLRIDEYPYILHIGGLIVILFEMSYFLFLFNKIGRWVASIAGVFMHTLISYFMYISFFAQLVIFYIFYIDFNRFFERRKRQQIFDSSKKISKLAFNFCFFILLMNFFAGMFNIDTYPFSAYPKYSATIPDEIEIIDFKTFPENINVHQVGKINNFDWENYGWLEYNIIKDYNDGKNVDKRLIDYWNIWLAYNQSLNLVDSVQVSIIKRPVSPEGRYDYIKSEPFYTFVTEKND